MADDNKAVGPLATAKLVALIKAATAKKYDKTGGKINGSAEITGDMHAGGAVQSDLLLSAPSVAVRNDAAGASVHINCSGDNAARITSLSSDGKSRYSRFAVGTPTGDNDATTKEYVDAIAAEHEAITVTSTEVSDLGYDASNGASRYSVTFDASFDSILANLAANKPMKFNVTLPDSTGGFPVSFSTGYVSALNDSDYLFTGTILNYPVVLSIGALGSATVELFGAYLPDPNPDDSDDGKVLAVNKHKWEIKAIPAGGGMIVDTELSRTSTNPVQNKVIKSALDGKMDKSGGTFTGNVSGQYFTGTWLQTTAASNLGRTPGKIAVLDDSGWVYYRTPEEIKSDIGASGSGADISTVLSKVYPVGSIYMSVNSTNPQNLFGGTWVQIKDRFLLAAGTTYKAGATGGEATHTLTENEIPEHRHSIWFPNAGGEQSAAIGYPEAGSKNTWYAEASKTGGAGGGGAHNNMPPYLSVYVWQRTA